MPAMTHEDYQLSIQSKAVWLVKFYPRPAKGIWALLGYWISGSYKLRQCVKCRSWYQDEPLWKASAELEIGYYTPTMTLRGTFCTVYACTSCASTLEEAAKLLVPIRRCSSPPTEPVY